MNQNNRHKQRGIMGVSALICEATTAANENVSAQAQAR